MTDPRSPLGDLDEVMEAMIRGKLVNIGHGRTLSMFDLILGWIQHVDKLKRESLQDQSGDPYRWNEHDYVAALFIRDFIQEGILELSGPLRTAVEKLVAQGDEEYLSFTQPGYRTILSRVAEVDPAERGWWWDRAPTSGSIAENLNRFYA